MTYLVIFILSVIVGSAAAQTAVIDCTVTTAAVPRLRELCEIQRSKLPAPPSRWGDPECATFMLWKGLMAAEREDTRSTVRATVRQQETDAHNEFLTNYPQPTLPAVCGDGVVEDFAEHAEACDDGNQVNGDGYENDCTLTP